LVLGMPNAPSRRYTNPDRTGYTIQPEQQLQLGNGTPQRVVDADTRSR